MHYLAQSFQKNSSDNIDQDFPTLNFSNQQNSKNQGTFIRPFLDDVDNRNDYKNLSEANIYNERERCYDAFSNLLRLYQQYNAENNLIRMQEFWGVLSSEGRRVLDISMCNTDWFSDIFIEMLIFYCPYEANQIPVVRNLFISSTIHSSSASSIATPTTASSNVFEKGNDLKQRKLEERMGPGGRGGFQVNNATRVWQGTTKPKYSSSAAPDKFELPSASFIGLEQFFFRFIVLTDSNRFMRSLEVAFMHEINKITESIATADAILDCTKICDMLATLKVLGKFYGLVLFSSQWPLPLPEKNGTIATQLSKYTDRKQRYFAAALVHEQLLRQAIRSGSVTATMPWIVESLKMLVWDANWQDKASYVDILGILQALQLSSLFSSTSRRLTSNRRFILTEVQALFLHLSYKGTPDITISFDGSECLSVPLNSMDDCDFIAQGDGFMKLVSIVQECVVKPLQGDRRLRSKEKSAQSSLLLPRQTPAKLTMIQSSGMSPSLLPQSASFVSTASSPSASMKNKDIKAKLFASPPGSKSKAADSSEHRAMQSFWQMHGQYFKLNTFVLEFLQQACVSQLRERVAAAVRELWNRTAQIKEHHTVVGGSPETYKAELEGEAEILTETAVSRGRLIVESVLEGSLQRLLTEFCAVFPNDRSVHNMAVHFIRRQASQLHKSLVDFMVKFTRRKLDEVVALGIQQYKRTAVVDTEPHTQQKEVGVVAEVGLHNVLEGAQTTTAPRTDGKEAQTKLLQSLKRCSHIIEFKDSAGVAIKFSDSLDMTVLQTEQCSIELIVESDPILTRLPLEDQVGEICQRCTSILSTTAQYLIATIDLSPDQGWLSLIKDGDAQLNVAKHVAEGCKLVFSSLEQRLRHSNKESQGRLSIEITKVYVQVITQLLYVDYTISTRSHLKGDYLSDVFVHACKISILSVSCLCRASLPLLKKPCVAYQQTCKNMPNLSNVIVSQFRAFMWRLFISLETNGDDKDVHGISSLVRAHKVDGAVANFPDPHILTSHKSSLSHELFLLLASLLQK